MIVSDLLDLDIFNDSKDYQELPDSMEYAFIFSLKDKPTYQLTLFKNTVESDVGFYGKYHFFIRNEFESKLVLMKKFLENNL